MTTDSLFVNPLPKEMPLYILKFLNIYLKLKYINFLLKFPTTGNEEIRKNLI